MIKELIFTGNLDLFNDLLNIYPENPTLIITTLLETIIALRRDGKKVENISEIDYKDIFTLLKDNEIGKEAIEEFLISKSDNPNLSIKDIKKELKIEKISEKDLKKIITKVVDENIAILKEKEMRAMGPLMGAVMKEVRGKIDGKVVSNELKTIIQKRLKELK